MRNDPHLIDSRRLAVGTAAWIGATLIAAAASGQPAAASEQPAAAPMTTRERLVRIVALEDARSLGDGWLRDRVFDPDAEARRQAVLALGRIGRPEAVEPLLLALSQDEAGVVRSSAAFALGILEDPLPEEGLAGLEAALADPAARVREKALEAIGRKGGARGLEALASHLAGIVETPDFAERREDVEASRRRTAWDEARLGLFALAALGASDEVRGQIPPGALEIYGRDGRPWTQWWVAAWSAAQLAEPALLPLHRAWADAPDPILQALGVRGLGRAGARDPGRAPETAGELAPRLNHPGDAVRSEAIQALGALARAGHPLPGEVGARLLAMLEEPAPTLRRAAAAALAHVTHEPAAPILVDWTMDESPEVRARALRALHHQDEEGFRLLMSGWSDPDPRARTALARALADASDPRIRDFLVLSLVSDADPEVRTAAIEAVGRMEAALASSGGGVDPEVEAALAERLEDPDPFARAAAAEALGRLGARLTEIRRAAEADGSPAPWFRLAALEALARGDGSEAVAFARTALGDPVWAVRREAHRFLRQAGETPPAPPAPAGTLEDADYDAMLRPPFTPVAWIDTNRGEIEVELFIADAPRTVWRFMRLARSGFYEGQPWSRPLPGFVVEAGDRRASPGEAIRSEINERTFMRGGLGMVEAGKDTGGAGFFITLLPTPAQNGRATLFGHVRSGFEVLERIEPGDRIRRVRVWDGVTPPGP